MNLPLKIFYNGNARLANGLTCDDILLMCDAEFENTHGRGNLLLITRPYLVKGV